MDTMNRTISTGEDGQDRLGSDDRPSGLRAAVERKVDEVRHEYGADRPLPALAGFIAA